MNSLFSIAGRRVWVAGHTGMLGRSLVERLKMEQCNLITVSRKVLDLTRQKDVEEWIDFNQPEVIFNAAARVGGIKSNSSFPAEFIYENLMINSNIIHAAKNQNVKKVVLYGSSCSYPKNSTQPIGEKSLMQGIPEPTNIWYALAKISSIYMAQAYRNQYNCDFISLVPTNAYGPWDNFNLDSSHVIPAMIRKINHAVSNNQKKIEFWGTGNPLREFIYVEDLADASIFLASNYSDSAPINIGTGFEISIRNLSLIISRLLNYNGEIIFNESMPDGAMRKILDSSKLINLGWSPKVNITKGLENTINWYISNIINQKKQID